MYSNKYTFLNTFSCDKKKKKNLNMRYPIKGISLYLCLNISIVLRNLVMWRLKRSKKLKTTYDFVCRKWPSDPRHFNPFSKSKGSITRKKINIFPFWRKLNFTYISLLQKHTEILKVSIEKSFKTVTFELESLKSDFKTASWTKDANLKTILNFKIFPFIHSIWNIGIK